MIKQRRVLLANPTNTASQSYRKPLVEPRRAKPDLASDLNLLIKKKHARFSDTWSMGDSHLQQSGIG